MNIYFPLLNLSSYIPLKKRKFKSRKFKKKIGNRKKKVKNQKKLEFGKCRKSE